MNESIIIFGLISALATLFSVLWFLWGVFILVSGKLRFPKPNLDGKYARIASLFIILPLFLALLIHAGLHEGFDWGRSGANKALQSKIGASIIYLTYLILSFFICRAYAKSKNILEIAKKNTDQNALTDIKQSISKSGSSEAKDKISVLGVVVPVIKDTKEFSRIVQEKGTPMGLLVKMKDFTVTYGELQFSVPNHETLSNNPFHVSAEDGPCRLFCYKCKKLLCSVLKMVDSFINNVDKHVYNLLI